MRKTAILAVLALFVFSATAYAKPGKKKYEPVTRTHTWKEKALDFSVGYTLLWAGYAASQPSVFAKITFEKWNDDVFRIGAVLWDGDEWYWNFVAHPYAGSEFYLLSRSRGYAPKWAFLNAAIMSTVFEATVEPFSEPFSTNDFVITPVVGSAVGWAREHAGLKLVNSNVMFYRFVGHVVYPETNLWFFENMSINPAVSFDGGFNGLMFSARF